MNFNSPEYAAVAGSQRELRNREVCWFKSVYLILGLKDLAEMSLFFTLFSLRTW
jgi:hypothetical protein